MCAVAGIGGVAAAVAPSAMAAASPSRVTIRDSRSAAVSKFARSGSVAASTPIDFSVSLALSDPAGADALVTAVSTPGSSSYHQYLTPDQWEARFSPSTASVQQVVSFLRASGFTVGSVPADRLSVPASGTASQIEHAFDTTLSLHNVHGKSLRFADSSLSVPSSLGAVITGVAGVDGVLATPAHTTGAPRVKARAHSSARRHSTSAASTPATQQGGIPQPAGYRIAKPCGTYYGQKNDAANPALDTNKPLPPYSGYPYPAPWAVCGYTGPQFRSAYGLTSGANGSGVTVAIVDAYESPTLYSDARQFAAINDPSNPFSPSQFSEAPPKSYTHTKECDASGWYGEQTLDVEAVHNTAPGAHVLYVGAKSCNTPDLNAALSRIVDGHLASVITNSYGDDAGDVLDSAASRTSTDNILKMADATGISVLFSSGDSGDEFTTTGIVSPDYPASSPYATAVGGTTLQIGSAGQRTGEFGWSTARSFLCTATYAALGGCTTAQEGQWLPVDETLDGGSGGGTSYVYPEPAYQHGIVPTPLADASTGSPDRVVPDISMEADPATGMLVGETQTFPDGTYYDQYRIGGTSVASPLFAGLIARADSQAGTSLGFLNPTLYPLAHNARAIYDVGPAGKQDMARSDYVNSLDASQGYLYTARIIDYEGQEQYCTASGQCTTRNVALNTAPGYDNMTGIGSPGAGLVPALAAAAKAAGH